MFAVAEIAGSQHKVAQGAVLQVEKLDAKEGSKLTSDKVLLRADGAAVEIGTPYLPGARVEFVVKSHGKSDKVLVYKKKAKKRYERTRGHRQMFTKIEITAVK